MRYICLLTVLMVGCETHTVRVLPEIQICLNDIPKSDGTLTIEKIRLVLLKDCQTQERHMLFPKDWTISDSAVIAQEISVIRLQDDANNRGLGR